MTISRRNDPADRDLPRAGAEALVRDPLEAAHRLDVSCPRPDSLHVFSVERRRERGTARTVLRSSGDPTDMEVSAIGGTLLINATGKLEASGVERLQEHIEAGDRPVVLDLSDVRTVEPEALDMLRNQWRALGDRLRVVAPHASAAAEALKRAGLRRFAVHGTLSGALTQAAE